jgi:hypothetical protein
MSIFHTLSKKIIVLIICLLSFSVFGQHTTVIPAEDTTTKVSIASQAVNFSFNLSSIPASATIQACKLQLTVGKSLTVGLTLQIKIAELEVGSCFLNSASFPENEVFGIPCNSCVKKLGDHTLQLSLIVSNEKKSVNLSVFGNGNHSPRLIIRYSLPTEQPVDWSMSHANAQHSGNTFMRFGGAVPHEYIAKEVSVFGDIQKDLVMYKNKIYIIDNKNSKTTLYALNPITKSRTLIADTLRIPVSMPIIDQFGRLYYFSENKVEVIDLENGNSKKKVIDIDNNKLLKTSPTIGPDGSLYLVFNDGITAYTPYPAVQKIWHRGFSGTKSPVTMNKKGTIAYFVSYSTNKIFALGATNGNTINSHLLKLIPTSNEGPTIPLVANNGNVYITNKLTNGDKIYALDSQLVQQKLIEGIKISQPVSGEGNNVYFVKDDSLYNYNTGASSFTDNIAVRSLVADQSDNVYCLGMDNKLYVYNGVKKSVFESTVSNTALQRALIIGKDGSVYSASSSSIMSFNANLNEAYVLKENDNQYNNKTFRGKKTTIPKDYQLSKNQILLGLENLEIKEDVIITPKANITLISNKKIGFERGFTVKKGAILSCKINNNL